jgi:hypothetical protein
MSETVPKEEHLRRLAAKTAKIEEANQTIATLRAQIAAAPDVSEIQARLDALQATHTELQATHDRHIAESTTREALLSRGVTDAEDMDLVRYRYSRLPEENRPALSEWLEGGAKTDRYLSALLGAPPAPETPPSAPQPAAPAAPATPAASAPPATPAPTVNTNNGVQSTPPLQSPLSLERISQMPSNERIKRNEEIQAFLGALT